MTQVLNAPVRNARRAAAGYAPGADRPLAGYARAMTVYGVATAAAAGLARLQGRRAPRLSPFDVLLVAAATHKVARTIAKDAVTSPLRAPFTRYRQAAGDAELAEDVRGEGTRHAVGELVTCPFCLAQWVATAFTMGMVLAPEATRLAATTMTAVAGSDFLQLAYAWAQGKAEG